MDRFREMQVFQAIADAGSFAGGAAHLNLSPPSATRIVSELEARLGVQLLTRTTRRLSLTDAGRFYLENARRLLSELDTVERAAAGESTVPQGHLRITASVTFGREVLSPILSDFLHGHAHVSASLLLFDRIVDIVEEGIDVGVRIGDLPDSTLVSTHVGEVRRVLVGSPSYLKQRGRPKSPGDLKSHDIIGFSGLMPAHDFRFKQNNKERRVSITPRLRINDALAALSFAEQGDGLTPALSYMIAERVKAKKLAPVLERFELPPAPVQLIYPHARMIAPKVRAFIDFAVPKLRRVLKHLSF